MIVLCNFLNVNRPFQANGKGKGAVTHSLLLIYAKKVFKTAKKKWIEMVVRWKGNFMPVVISDVQ